MKRISKIDQLSAAIVLVNENKVLLQLRDDKPDIVLPGYWCIPGGKVNQGENIKSAAQRELKEETGYVSHAPRLFFVETYQLPDGKRIKRHIFFEDYDGIQEIKCFEGQKMEFKSPKDFNMMKIYPGHGDIVKKAIRLTKNIRV